METAILAPGSEYLLTFAGKENFLKSSINSQWYQKKSYWELIPGPITWDSV
jgi:hypothetical protein